MKDSSKRKPNLHGWAGIIILILSEILLIMRVEPVFSWFYSFAWWSYILITDSIVYRLAGNSLIMNRPRRFIMLLPWSVTIWLIFEVFNLSLNNWSYVDLPRNILLRWPGYAIAYATVLPGLFETYELLEALGLLKRHNVTSLSHPRRLYLPFVLVGAAMLAASAVFPLYCFGLVWGGFVFLLEPFLHRWGGVSLLRRWEAGSLRTFLVLMAAGFFCGILWEFWNFWAGAKWTYTVPFVGFWKIFEMPLLGFLGFLPFAVECFVMYSFIVWALHVKGWEREVRESPGPPLPVRCHVLVYAVMACFWVVAFWLIDTYTALSFI